MLMLTLITATS